jgi:hypothetical protein
LISPAFKSNELKLNISDDLEVIPPARPLAGNRWDEVSELCWTRKEEVYKFTERIFV